MRPSVLLASLFVVGCGGAVEGASVRSAIAGGKVDLGLAPAPHTVVLQFEAKTPGTRPFPFPFVDVKIGATSTRLLIDSGASAHAIDSALVATAQLAAPVHTTSLLLDGWGPLADQPVAVIDLPADLRAHGIGGVLSPELLAKGVPAGQAVVVDLVRSHLRAEPMSSAWASVEDLGFQLSTGKQPFCAAGAGQLVSLDATVEGEAMKLAIDTSTSRSFLVASSKSGAKASARPVLGRSITHVAMTELPVTIHGGVPFTVGGWSSTADVGVAEGQRDAQCGFDGRLGMDVLQRCALAMTSTELVLGCRAPAGR